MVTEDFIKMSALSVMTTNSPQNGEELDDTVIEESVIPDIMTHSKQKTQKQKVRKGGMADEDFDDSASVSSSMSSASEQSTKNDTKVKKFKKQRCKIHSQPKVIETSGNSSGSVECGKQLESVVDEDDVTGNGKPTETVQLKCTCKKTSKDKLSSKSRVKRPEPEGSLLSDQSKACFLDDLERVIYSDEPLFSDAEDQDQTLEDQIRAESERFHRRVTNPENIFSAVQMLSTNTMMKLAIIQTELKNVKDISLRRSEGEIVSASKRAELLHESFEHTENSFRSVSGQISEASKAIGTLEKSQPAPMQGSRTSGDDKKQSHVVDKEQQRMTAVSSDAASKRRSFGGKHLVNEVDLEMVRCNLEAAEMTISEIEEEQMVISNAKKSRNTSEFEEIIHRLTQRLGQAEKQAFEAEQMILHLGQRMEDLKETRLADKKKHKPISSEINASFAELSVYLS